MLRTITTNTFFTQPEPGMPFEGLAFALFRCIQRKEITNALKLIDTMVDISFSSLRDVDEHQNNLLFYSLQYGCDAITKRLLSLFSDSPFLTNSNNNRQTLLHFAAKYASEPLFDEILLELAKINANFWFHLFLEDSRGETPLHAALHSDLSRITIITKIILALKKCHLIESIDLCDQDGNSAAHLAILNLNYQALKVICAENIHFFLKNNQHKTPFDLLAARPEEEQRRFFRELNNNELKKKIYLAYRQLCDKEPNNAVAFKVYKDLATLISLKERVIYHLEFENPIISSQVKTLVLTQTARGEKISIIANHRLTTILPEPIATQIPNYLKKVKELESAQGLIPLVCLEMTQATTDHSPSGESIPELLEKDRDTLFKLTTDITNYIADLNSRPRTSFIKKRISLVACLIILAGYVTLITVLWVQMAKYKKKSAKASNSQERYSYANTADDYFTGGLMSTLFGLALSCISCAALGTWGFQDKYLAPNREPSLQDILAILNDNILLKLEFLKKFETEEALQVMPTTEENMEALKNRATALQEKYTIDDLITQLTDFQTEITTLVENMNRSHHPLSFLFKPAREDHRINIMEIEEENDEIDNVENQQEFAPLLN